jgi:hypothetical protein
LKRRRKGEGAESRISDAPGQAVRRREKEVAGIVVHSMTPGSKTAQKKILRELAACGRARSHAEKNASVSELGAGD